MNTVLSDKKVQEWKKEDPIYIRGIIKHTQTFNTTPDKLFPLLCPTAEFDWIDGWHCEVIYSQSLYQEYNAIFKTNYFNIDETWVVSHFEANRVIEFVRVSEDLSIKVDVRICDNLNGTSTGDWIIYATALTLKGNEILKNMQPEDEPIGVLIDALDHYINHDEIKPLPDNIFNKQK
ncbi:hypothetical protein [Sulfurimonas sp. CS5]|jgi:hypothetical protein|uniref:hypothetical protein n=1 Tax=Sulfurimonas sp. CS5 TaxID=3391145 RepID=UPI0039ED7950